MQDLEEFVKLNTNSTVKGNPCHAGLGGILRDEQGKWLGGYYGKVGISTSLVAEIWSIREAIEIAKEFGINKLTVETDSKLAVEMLNKRCNIPLDIFGVDSRLYNLSQGMDIRFQHTYREGNFCVDFLANLGV